MKLLINNDVLRILQELNDEGHQCLVIGGAVRDAIIGYKIPTGRRLISEIALNLDVTEKKYEYVLMGRHLIDAPSTSLNSPFSCAFENR